MGVDVGGVGGKANGVKSHPKRMEMKKKFLPVQKLPRKLLGDAQMGFSNAALSKFS